MIREQPEKQRRALSHGQKVAGPGSDGA
jgi:hypothetical protein